MSQERMVNLAFVAAALLVWFLSAHLFAGVFDLVRPEWDAGIIGREFRLSNLLGVSAGIIGGIALGNRVDFAHVAAAGGANVSVGVDVNFIWGIGEDDGAYIAAFHDDIGACEVAALESYEFVAHLRDCGDGGDIGVDCLAAQSVAGVAAVDGDGGA